MVILAGGVALMTLGIPAYQRYEYSQCIQELAKSQRPAAQIQALCEGSSPGGLSLSINSQPATPAASGSTPTKKETKAEPPSKP